MSISQFDYDFDDLLRIYCNCENMFMSCNECPLCKADICSSLIQLESNFVRKYGVTPKGAEENE